MRRLLLAVAVGATAVLLVVGIDQLSDLTQTRPDLVDHSVASVIVFEVRTHAYDGTTAEAADAQWGVCAGTIGGQVRGPGLEQLDESHFRVTVTPAIGPRGQQRLTGCLNDAAVDRVIASFVSIETVPAI
jgi:hypothetical protein